MNIGILQTRLIIRCLKEVLYSHDHILVICMYLYMINKSYIFTINLLRDLCNIKEERKPDLMWVIERTLLLSSESVYYNILPAR